MGAWSWLVELVRRPSRARAGVEIPGPAPGLAIHRRTSADDLLHVAVVTGDPALDAVACIHGDRVLALSLLDEPARSAVARALQLGLVVEDGRVRGEASTVEIREQAAVLAAALAPTERPPVEVLAERLGSEPLGEVRLAILRALIDQGPPWEDEALRRAKADPDGRVRLLAATQTSDTEALAPLTLDPSVPPDVRDHAFHQLRRLDPRRLRMELSRAIRDPARLGLALERDPSLLDPELLLGVVERATAPLARQALLQLRDASPRAVLARLSAIRRPDVAGAIAVLVEQLEVAHAGERLAAELGLDWAPEQRTCTGRLEGLPVEVRLEPGQAGFYVTGLPSAVALEGDGALVWVPADQRERIGRLLDEAPQFGIQDGRLHAVGPMAPADELVARARRIGEVVAAFQWLARQVPADRLGAAFGVETEPVLRRKLGARLLAERPDRAEAALHDEDAGVRTLAATHLGRSDVLLRVVLDTLEAPVRRDALVALAELGDADALAGAVTVGLDDAALRATALAIVGRHKLRAHADHVASLLDAAPPGQEDGWVRIAVQVLGVLKVASTERHLLRALESDDEQLRRLAILALGQAGSPRAIPPLKALASGWRVGWEANAARTALEAIRARVTAGGLSVADDGGGKLALSARGGELGVAEDEKG